MYSNKLGLREAHEEYHNGVFCKLLTEPFDKMYMTRGQGQLPRVTGKYGFRKVAFLLKKSVITSALCKICMWSCMNCYCYTSSKPSYTAAFPCKFCSEGHDLTFWLEFLTLTSATTLSQRINYSAWN